MSHRADLETYIEAQEARRAELRKIEPNLPDDAWDEAMDIWEELDRISDRIGRAKNALFDLNQEHTLRERGHNLSEF